jgi:hypothetical protein
VERALFVAQEEQALELDGSKDFSSEAIECRSSREAANEVSVQESQGVYDLA